MKFAAFIMTFERPAEVLNAIEALLRQSFPPQKIVVVDNSESDETQLALTESVYNNVSYHRMGYNSGPAGAAMVGLKMLANEGFDWIYWGDDDDPPAADDDFEGLFNLLESATSIHDKIGIVSKGGGRLNRFTGRTSSFRNKQIVTRIMKCDFVPGNSTTIISGEMIRSGVLPFSELFFGFEELDFCLRARASGYKVIFDGHTLLQRRLAKGKADPNYKWKGKSIGVMQKLWRQYYSTRNILFVLASNKLYFAVGFIIARTIIKSVYGFKYGMQYGTLHLRIQFLALKHYITGTKGQTDLTGILIRKLTR